MKQFVPAHILKHHVAIPPSKSYAQRAILAAAFCKKSVVIHNIGASDDVVAILKIAEQFGATITATETGVVIAAGTNEVSTTLNCNESGLGVRLTTAFAAVIPGDFFINGAGSLLNRSMTEFDVILPQLNVQISSTNGYLPLKISGNAKGGKIFLDGSLSSQYLSGLLMALPLLENDSEIHVSNLKSIPYIDCTIAVLSAFGITITHSNYEVFYIKGRQQYNRNEPYQVEGDYSGASIWMVHGALKDGIIIEGLNEQSFQADKEMLTALKKAGVDFNWHNHQLIIEAGKVLPFDFDATHCPDLFPSLVVLGAAANGMSKIKGLSRLPHKESNRGEVLKSEFGKLGLKIVLNEDEMIVYGTGQLVSHEVDAHNDHRIAMACGIASSLTKRGITITGSKSVAKSYPSFWKELI